MITYIIADNQITGAKVFERTPEERSMRELEDFLKIICSV
ncbi:hypothetical protein C817_01371 [Dorea sp. 5-2]|nr:hypothetical protein C817_01371 [Dorea sp. 5-2]